ncbi:MAG: SAM-dependent methyltransferase [Egibacteraceae bacterium]
MPNNEWGDFQTPIELAEQVLDTLPNRTWGRVLEPTCGMGNFLTAAKRLGDVERVGIEIQPNYADQAMTTGATVLTASIFDLRLGASLPWAGNGPLLVVGNPPWVTNADLGSFGSINLPPKRNLRNLRGIDALTGASNFDIAEFIWLKLILELADAEPTIALLCKTQVARNVISYCHHTGFPISACTIRRIDAKKWFGANVDACLLTVTVGGVPDWRCPVYDTIDTPIPGTVIGFAEGRLVADIDAHTRAAFVDGACPFEWRQGVKHDAVAVMEFNMGPNGVLRTRSGYEIDLEADHVFPLLKATDLHRGRLIPQRAVVVTQRSLADNTERLATDAPRVWRYLTENSGALDGRRSSIYLRRPRFCMFGIGDYTFAPWKVAVSGLHATPVFRVIGPADGKPIVLDDTCYFVAFDAPEAAAITAAILHSGAVQDLLRALIFPDSKRPVTKRLLQRINLHIVLERTEVATILDIASTALGSPISFTHLDHYFSTIDGELLLFGM